MQTLTDEARGVKLEIKGVAYLADRLADGPDGERIVRVEKLAGANEVYDVATERGLVTCTCPHYEFKLRGNTASPCKHGRSVIEAGLLGKAIAPALVTGVNRPRDEFDPPADADAPTVAEILADSFPEPEDDPAEDTTDHAPPEPGPAPEDRAWHALMLDRAAAEASWHELADAEWDEAYADRSGQAFPDGWPEAEVIEAAGYSALATEGGASC